jgi:predicted nucleic acid-binding Zn ribbon protein
MSAQDYAARKLLSNRKRCAHCGKKFRSSRPKQRFCSVRCRQTNYRISNPEKIRAIRRAWDLRNHPRKQPELKACGTCSKPFETSDPQKKFCSEKCRDADHYKRHREKILARRKKWIAANRDKARAQVRRHHARHRDVLNAKTKARYAERKAELERLRALARVAMAGANGQGQAQPEASKPNQGGRPAGMKDDTKEDARELLRYMEEWDRQKATHRGAMLYASRKVYGSTVESRKAIARGYKTLKKYRTSLIKSGTKPTA